MTSNLSADEIEVARARFADLDDPERVAALAREYGSHRRVEEIAKARLAKLDGGWLLDELGGLRRPLTADQLTKARAEFAAMETEAIVHELIAEWYFFHPDILPLADARLAQLKGQQEP